MTDIVREESGRQRRGMSKRPRIDDRNVLRGGAETDPEPVATTVDRQMASPAGQVHPAHLDAAQHIDGDDTASARVGDERVPAVGMRCGVAGLDEPSKHVANPVPVDDRDGSHRRVADDCALPDQLDRPRIGQGRDGAHNAVRAEIDDGESRLGVAGDERRRSAGELRTERKRSHGSGQSELATVHRHAYGRCRSKGPGAGSLAP